MAKVWVVEPEQLRAVKGNTDSQSDWSPLATGSSLLCGQHYLPGGSLGPALPGRKFPYARLKMGGCRDEEGKPFIVLGAPKR